MKIHSYFLITESTSKTESKIIFCMITLAGRSDSVEERACSCENDFVRLNLLVMVILAGQGHITNVPAGVERFQGACGGAAIDLNFLHFIMTLVLVMFSIGLIIEGAAFIKDIQY